MLAITGDRDLRNWSVFKAFREVPLKDKCLAVLGSREASKALQACGILAGGAPVLRAESNVPPAAGTHWLPKHREVVMSQ